MVYKWIENIEEFIKIKTNWDKVLKLSGIDNPFLVSDLIIVWWKNFGKQGYLRIFLLLENGELIGGFPLYIRKMDKTKGYLRCLQHIGDSYANITEPFFLTNFIKFETYFNEALKSLKGWDYLDLPRVRDNRFFLNSKFNEIRKNLNSSPIIEITQNAQDYLKTRGYKLRRNVRHDLRKVEQMGGVSFQKLESIEEIDFIIDAYVDFSIQSRTERNKKSNYLEKKQIIFLKELIHSFAQRNLIDAHILKIDEQLVAVAFGYRYGKGYKWVFTSYNPIYAYLSIGNLLIYKLIDFAYCNGDPYIDMYAGNDVFYKKHWCNNSIPLFQIRLFNSNIIGKLVFVINKLLINH